MWVLKIFIFFCAWISIGASDFKIYWNIPSFMCKKYNILFENLNELYGIVQNQNDTFRGDQISILYDPGSFPAILQNSSSKEYFYRNHGVPQMGNLSMHLKLLEEQIDELIPDPKNSGVAIIDFESWRPIYRQNFGTLKPYKTLSMQIEQKKHPLWSKQQIEKEAENNFEIGAKTFMLQSLMTLKKLRPNALWGYYAFPYCFNGNAVNSDKCAKGVDEQNNKIRWMFQNSGAIFPSVYLQERLSPELRIPLVKGRVREAVRVANTIKKGSQPKVLVYHRYLYTDNRNYIEGTETLNIFKQIKRSGGNGIVLWGSSFDLDSRNKCEQFELYVKQTLGPISRLLTSYEE